MLDFDEKEIIAKLRSLRRDKGVSLNQFARMTGLTKGYLSQIEHSTKTPPFSTLGKIAYALGVDITYFFSDKDQVDTKITIVDPKERRRVAPGGLRRGYGYEALAFKKTGKNMEPYLITIDSQGGGSFKHDGEEFLYILEGTLELNYGGQRYVVKKGYSIYFDSGVEHSGRPINGDKVKMLCVIYNYRRP